MASGEPHIVNRRQAFVAGLPHPKSVSGHCCVQGRGTIFGCIASPYRVLHVAIHLVGIAPSSPSELETRHQH